MSTASSSLTTTTSSISSLASADKALFDLAIWSTLPGLLWAIAAIGGLIYFRQQIKHVFSALTGRLTQGSALKFGVLEIGATSGLVAQPGSFSNEDTRIGVYEDDKSREEQRNEIYKQTRGVMLVHRLQKSNNDGQLYDVLIYVVPHKSSSLAGVTKVEYFFGSFWGNKIYPSADRSRGFPVVTSAYGAFLCTAKLHFNDGTSEFAYRYVDFEMGSLALRHSV